MQHSAVVPHGPSVPNERAQKPNPREGGRPVHPCHTLTEALLECIAAIDSDVEAMEHAARASVAIAKALHMRAQRARLVSRAEIVEAVSIAEEFCAATTGARVALA